MELTEYFTFLGPSDIRIKGSRIGIQSVLYEYIYRSRTPEQIKARYETLRLDQVYATILYYLLHQETIDAYMAAWLAREEQGLAAQAQDPTAQAFQERLRQERAQREAHPTPDTSPVGSA
jgi:uncharacterized protein (DUF433 family)